MFDPFENYNFEGDGCTFWFDTWRGIDLTGCCAVHDEKWGIARALAGFFRYLAAMLGENMNLLACAIEKGAWDWGVLAFVGTSLFAVFVATMRQVNHPKG